MSIKGGGDMKRLSILLLVLMVVYSIETMKDLSVNAESNDEVTILFTHDLHDNLLPFEAEEKQVVGGVARLYEAIEEERKKSPEALLVDAGDFSMGTLFQTIFSTHAPMLQLMGMMDYDVITFGNHEFDFRADGLAKALQSARESNGDVPPIIASNISFPRAEDGRMETSIEALKKEMDNYGVTPYKVIEKQGVKIGVFGLLGKEAASNAPMAGVTFDDKVAVAKKMVKVLKEDEKVDILVALSHSGTSDIKKKSEDEILAEKVPELDVIVSGHSHTTLAEPIIIKDTVIGSSGEYGEHLGVMNLVKNDRGRWDLQDYRLVHIDDSFKENQMMAEKVKAFKKIVEEDYLSLFDLKFDHVLAQTAFDFSDFKSLYENHQESTIGNLIGDAYRHTVKEIEGDRYEEITASVIPVGVIRNSFYKGDITVSDVFNVSSLGIGPDGVSGYPVLDVYLTGKELKTVAEVDASVAPLMPAAQLYISGLAYTFNPNRLLFNKVTDVQIENSEGVLEDIQDDKLYRLVAGLYTAQMLPIVGEESFGLLSVVPKKKDGRPIENFEDQIIYVDEGKELKEWYAIAHYLRSFEEMNGVAEVPDEYASVQNRKNVNTSKNIRDLMSQPNGIAWTLYAVIVGALIGGIVGVRYILKRRRAK